MSESPTDRMDQTMPAAPGDPSSEGSGHPAGETQPTSAQAAPEPALPPASQPAGEPVATGAEPATPPAEAAPAPVALPTHKCRVTRVTAEEVFLQLEDGQQGTVPLIEFALQPLPKDGDEVTVIIEGADEARGLLSLSKRQADEADFWQSVKPGDVLEGVVTGMNKGGLDIDIGGARAFLPASQVDVHRLKDISTLIGEHIRCAVTQVDRVTRDLIVSRRKIVERERKEKRAELVHSLVEGAICTGTVKNLADFGAFVDIGGVEGLLHVGDMSWGRVRNPAEVVQQGQELQVRILKVDRQTGKVSLGLKQVQPDPWESVESRYPAGSRIKAPVARLADFGAFLELEPGVDALLPISEMSWSKRIAAPADVVKPGDVVEVVVLKVDSAKRRISVGLKQATENPWAHIETKYPLNNTAKGKVSKVMEYGAFVELEPGLEGLIHISELADKRVNAVSDIVKEGQEVQVRVIKIDMGAQRISLSMRPIPPKREAHVEEHAGKDHKPGKKRPLRGGLSSHFEWF
jgi:small subunit ribosomal protein S1